MSWALPPPVDSLRPRSAEGWRQGMVLALAAHGLLLVALMFSVQWRTSAPEVVEAEVWSEVPRPASPSTVPPPSPPPPAPAPAPIPVVEPPPATVPPPVAPPPPPSPPAPAPAPPADLPVARPKPERAAREVFVPDPPKVRQRLEAARPRAETPPPPAPAPKPEPAPAPKPVADSRPPAKTAPAPAAATPSKQDLEKARQDNIRRMLANLSEDRLQSAGPSAEYAGRIKARVKPNIILPADIPGNPVAVVEVRCAPDGRIIGRKLLTASGVPAWDDAVLRAIDRTEILPLDERGRIPTPMLLELRPKDF